MSERTLRRRAQVADYVLAKTRTEITGAAFYLLIHGRRAKPPDPAGRVSRTLQGEPNLKFWVRPPRISPWMRSASVSSPVPRSCVTSAQWGAAPRALLGFRWSEPTLDAGIPDAAVSPPVR
jgi:hypothetical protein